MLPCTSGSDSVISIINNHGIMLASFLAFQVQLPDIINSKSGVVINIVTDQTESVLPGKVVLRSRLSDRFEATGKLKANEPPSVSACSGMWRMLPVHGSTRATVTTACRVQILTIKEIVEYKRLFRTPTRVQYRDDHPQQTLGL